MTESESLFMNKISTSALSKKHQLTTKDLFDQLLNLGYIQKDGDTWKLTNIGLTKGGAYKDSKQFGQYIVWPEDLTLSELIVSSALVTSTVLGKHFDLSANKINFILSEIGWLKKAMKGWVITPQGEKQGGIQAEDKKSGVPYVRWPESILQSKSLNESIRHVKGTDEPLQKSIQLINEDSNSFREKFPAHHRSADGHMVRSKAEMLIDNWLYMAEIVHAYERKLPVEEEIYCDFYIPAGKVYIEYWGYETDPKYMARKETKIALYRKYGFDLIELQDSDIHNLDDVLPRLLLKYGVQAY